MVLKCYLCRSLKIKKFLVKHDYQLYRCGSCGLIFYEFREGLKEFLDKQYARGYFKGQEDLCSYYDYAADMEVTKRNFRDYLKQISVYQPAGRLLDVGCAYGYFMQEAQHAGYQVWGIDPSEHAISQAKKGLPTQVKKATLAGAGFAPRSFEVITMFDVFEHLPDPRADLKVVNKILTDGGLLVIATGDTGSFWAKIWGKKWTFYNPPQHIFYFNQENIIRILQESGFKVIKIEKSGKWLPIRYILHLARTVRENRLERWLFPFFQNNFLGKIALFLRFNDNMIIFAQKNVEKG